jgi:hypothetical protein
MQRLAAAGATSAATFRDLRRRPGILLASAAVAALLFVLPELCTRAVEESRELALQIGLSTILVFLTLVAGFTGLRCGAAEGDLGATAEWRAAPIRPAGYVLGRFAGIVALACVLFAALSLVLAASGSATFADEPLPARVACFAAAGTLLSAAQFAAAGLFLAAATTPQLAAVLLIATLVATRTIVPEFAAQGGIAAAFAAALPDPARLDLSRELAFQRPVDTPAALLACAAAALQTAALLVAASSALARRES